MKERWGAWWRSPPRIARSIFTPEADGGLIDDLYIYRAVVGVVFWVALRLTGNLTTSRDAQTIADYAYMTLGYLLTPVVLIGFAGIFYWLTSPQLRPRARSTLRVPISRGLIWSGAATIFLLVLAAPRYEVLSSRLDTPGSGASAMELLGFLLIGVPLLIASLWIVYLIVMCLAIGSFYQLRAVDGHPYLPAATTVTVAWGVTLGTHLFPDPGLGVSPIAASPLIQFAAAWGAPLSFSLLALIDILHLRKSGIKVSDGVAHI